MCGTALITAVKYVGVGEVRGGGGSVCVIVGVNVIVWVGVDVIALVRECVGETALNAAVMYVWGEGGVCVGVTVWCECGCDCVCGCACNCVGEGVCRLDSLDCCRRMCEGRVATVKFVCVCVEGRERSGCVWV